MRRPGDRLRRAAARFFSRSDMERLIDPAVADLQAEYSALQSSSVWTRIWTLLRGYVACAKVISLCAARPGLSAARTGFSWAGIVLLVFLGLIGPSVFPLGQVALWYVTGGPPLDFDAPRNGQVVAHIDVLGKFTTDIARIRISEAASGSTVWDVTPTTSHSECWNGCWNLTLKTGPNLASFAAGRQQFNASVPQASSFTLTPGTVYLFEAWDGKGRVQRNRFKL